MPDHDAHRSIPVCTECGLCTSFGDRFNPVDIDPLPIYEVIAVLWIPSRRHPNCPDRIKLPDDNEKCKHTS
jgi:hypothetical protein